MTHMLEEMRTDLIKLRNELPANSHRSKGILKRIDRALLMLINNRRSIRKMAGLGLP